MRQLMIAFLTVLLMLLAGLAPQTKCLEEISPDELGWIYGAENYSKLRAVPCTYARDPISGEAGQELCQSTEVHLPPEPPITVCAGSCPDNICVSLNFRAYCAPTTEESCCSSTDEYDNCGELGSNYTSVVNCKALESCNCNYEQTIGTCVS